MTNNKEKLVSYKLLNANDCVSNLLISLLGETSFFFKINVEGTKFVVIPESLLSLPSFVALKMEKIAQMSTNIRNIENWKKEFIGVDCIKRAFIEAISELFNNFLNIVDTMRMNHISNKTVVDFDTIMSFVIEWQDRINYMYRLTEASYNKCGMEIMNIVFMEWTMQCIADWTYNLLEEALSRMSISFHKLINSWLLDGKINNRINWMIREEQKDDLFLQNSNSNANNSLIENTNLVLNKTNVSYPDFYERYKIDWNFVPISLNGCHGIIKKIFDVGRNVNFLRELRHQKVYEYRLKDRTNLLEDDEVNKTKLWYSVAERGHLYSIIQQYSEIVNEDILNEIMIKQRLLDHISFVHVHFFLLNGDFSAAIYEAIRDSPIKNRLKKKKIENNKFKLISPFHNFQRVSSTANRSLSHPDFVAQACINYAFNFTSQLKAFDGLKQYIIAEKVQHASSSLTYLEDLVRLGYKPVPAIFPVLSDFMLQTYNKIFINIVQYQILHGRINEVSISLSDVLRIRNRRYQKQNQKNLNNVCFKNVLRFVQYCLFALRNVVASLQSYFYNEVLEPECKEILKKLRSQSDLQSLILTHNNFIHTIVSLLFLQKNGQKIFQSLRHSVHLARFLIKAIEEFVIALENTEAHFNLLNLKNLNKKEPLDKNTENCLDELNKDQLNTYKLFLIECYNAFLESLNEIKISFEDAKIYYENLNAVPHWQNFELPTLFSFVNK